MNFFNALGWSILTLVFSILIGSSIYFFVIRREISNENASVMGKIGGTIVGIFSWLLALAVFLIILTTSH